MRIRRKACHKVVILCIEYDVSIATCFLGGGGVVVAKNLALYAFDRSYTPPSQDKAEFTYPAHVCENTAECVSKRCNFVHIT